jgi:hypothetical protein
MIALDGEARSITLDNVQCYATGGLNNIYANTAVIGVNIVGGFYSNALAMGAGLGYFFHNKANNLQAFIGHPAFGVFTAGKSYVFNDGVKFQGVVATGASNLGVGTSDKFGSGTGVIAVANAYEAPTTSDADAFHMYSADISAGNATPHFKTEGGTVIKLTQPIDSGASPSFTSVVLPGNVNILVDGGLENWDSDTDLTSWTEYKLGTTTINKDGADKHGGSFSCRFDIDSSNNGCWISQSFSLVPLSQYQLSFWYKSAVGKYLGVGLLDSTETVQIDSNGTWGTTGIVLDSATWAKFTVSFVAHADYTNYMIFIQDYNATSSSIWIDDVAIVGSDTYGGGVVKLNGTQVLGTRVVDARCDDAINSGDATTDGVIDALRDAMIQHGLIAAA